MIPEFRRISISAVIAIALAFSGLFLVAGDARIASVAEGPTSTAMQPGDWPQWLGSPGRNNTPSAKNIPTQWDAATKKNIRWTAALGSKTYGSPVVANGKVFIGTNNGAGYVKRFPPIVDLGCLLCFDERTGKCLWQHSNEKLPQGRVFDEEQVGVCSTPLVEGNRLWYVSNRCEVVCLDTEGFIDAENDGPHREEASENLDEADVVWKLDMIQVLKVAPRQMCRSSVTLVGDTLFVCTSNGSVIGKRANPEAPSFLAIDKHTGAVLWSDDSPGENVLTGQWSSPAVGILAGVEQVIFGGGDGWLYSFDPRGDNGKSRPLWKFDCNPKDSRFFLERSTRNPIISTPIIYDDLVYIAVGEDPRHGEGSGHLWCVDPTKRGDVSSELVLTAGDKPVPPKRLNGFDAKSGDFVRQNPNSAAVWLYVGAAPPKFDSTMHRTTGSAAIANGLLFIADQSGLLHCLDAKTGAVHWTHDMLAMVWGTPLIVENRVYVADQDGDVAIVKLSNLKELVTEQNIGSPIRSTPIVANDVLYIAADRVLFAIGASPAK